MLQWREPPDVRSADGKYHLREFCAWDKWFIHMLTRTFWTAEQVDALFPVLIEIPAAEWEG
jgi:hypothetical protein